ncbi:hypothetical protein ACFWOL_03160 [Streptomyces sp. NPDC058442]|uniref:hypothetical protein n=1 Tax=Streptomyces sp. NPDC058442 TaxID=3346503 RepID=UPI00365FB256
MHARTTAIAIIAIITATLTACGGDSEPEAAPTSEPRTTTTAPSVETSEPEPSPTELDVLAFVDTWEWETVDDIEGDIAGAVTVLGYKQGVKSIVTPDEEFSTDGYVWAALEIKTCSIKGTFGATTEPWTLSYDDGTRIEPSSSTYDDFPKPEFPFETRLTTGKCVKGNVVYPVPGNQQPAAVVYAPYGLDTPTEWTVPAK